MQSLNNNPDGCKGARADRICQPFLFLRRNVYTIIDMKKNNESANYATDSCKVNHYPYCISVDWFEVCCYGAPIEKGERIVNGMRYEIIDEEKNTRIFKKLYKVVHRGLDYFYIQQEPISSALKRGLTLVKVANRVLYSEKYVPLLIELLKSLGLHYKGVSRIDIAYDCNYFYDGRSPKKFIRDYISKPLDKKGGIYLANVQKHIAFFEKSISSNTQWSYIKFGMGTGGRSAYIYDKSLELSEVKDKPWIRKVWADNGLINDEKHHVWRSEISIKSQGKQLLNLDTGELFALHPSFLDTYEQVCKIFHFYAAKSFDFRINKGQKNRRNFPPLRLFDTTISVTCVPKKVSIAADTGRSEKVCRNTLERVSRTYVDLSDSVRHSLAAAIEFMGNISAIKAARYGQEQYKQYLDMFASCKFITEEDIAYFHAIEEARAAKEEISVEEFYDKYIQWCRYQLNE